MSKNLEKAFAANKRLFLLYGQEEYVLDKSIDQIKDHFLKPDQADFNLDIIDTMPKDPFDLINKCNTLPFMADFRLVVLKNIGIFDLKDKLGLEPWVDELAKLPSTSVLIIKEESIDKRKKIYKFFQKEGYIEEFDYLNEKDIIRYLGRWFHQRNLRIKTAAILLLLERVGSDLTTIINECDKLANYAQEVVTEDMVKDLVRERLESKIFSLTDALGAKDREGVIRHYHIMVENRESMNHVLFMIGRHIKLLYQTKLIQSSKRPGTDLMQVLGLPQFVARKLKDQAKLFSQSELNHILKELVDLEWDFKRGKIDLEIGLELFLINTSRRPKV